MSLDSFFYWAGIYLIGCYVIGLGISFIMYGFGAGKN